MKFTEIKISGLKDGRHQFHFDLNSSFLTEFSTDLFENPNVGVNIELTMSETMIKSEIEIKGTVDLICDRSLDQFKQSVLVTTEHYFKFGEEEKEMTDELEIILKDSVSINFDQLVFDFIALSLPSKRLHPRFHQDEQIDENDGMIIFSTEQEQISKIEKETTDPRWAKLKELNV